MPNLSSIGKMEQRYIIERPPGIETWFLWDLSINDVIKTGSIETVTEYLREMEDGKPESRIYKQLISG